MEEFKERMHEVVEEAEEEVERVVGGGLDALKEWRRRPVSWEGRRAVSLPL